MKWITSYDKFSALTIPTRNGQVRGHTYPGNPSGVDGQIDLFVLGTTEGPIPIWFALEPYVDNPTAMTDVERRVLMIAEALDKKDN